jgi:hypothetical protein
MPKINPPSAVPRTKLRRNLRIAIFPVMEILLSDVTDRL